MTKRQWARLRQGIYGVSSIGLKTAGVYGLISDEKSQALLLLVSAVVDLAFFYVDLPKTTQPEETEETQYE